MKYYLIAERYAGGLSESIEDNGQLEAALAQLEGLSELFRDSHDFHSLLANPAINIEKRLEVLRELLQKEDLLPQVARLTEVLLRRKRIAIIGDVAEVFGHIVDERLNRVTARVTTATEMSEEQKSRIANLLERFSGKQVYMQNKIEPAILGGVVARMGDAIIDGSVRTRLRRLKETLLTEDPGGASS